MNVLLRRGLLLLALGACEQAPPIAEASRTAREFLEAVAQGRHDDAARYATGDVLDGVEVLKATRTRERSEHPAEVALLDKVMREQPPDIELRAPRRHEDTAEVRAVVTTRGPRGPERVQYELWLVWREDRWRVYRWQRR
jgi:hypothetical protein